MHKGYESCRFLEMGMSYPKDSTWLRQIIVGPRFEASSEKRPRFEDPFLPWFL